MRDGLPEVNFIFKHFLLFTNIAHLSRRLPRTRYQSSAVVHAPVAPALTRAMKFTNDLLILYSLFAFRIQLFLDHSKILTQDCDTPSMFVRKIFVIRYLYYNYEMYVLY